MSSSRPRFYDTAFLPQATRPGLACAIVQLEASARLMAMYRNAILTVRQQ